jgi:beta-N-acetylhexosaminidase
MQTKSLKKLASNLLLVGFHGLTARDEGVQAVMDQLGRGMLAGVILFGYNIESASQVTKLIFALRKAAKGRSFIVAVDQEGGRVARFSSDKGFMTFPSAKSAADEFFSTEGRNPNIERDSYEMALMLNGLGVNLNFAPCVDVDCDDESFQCPVIGKIERSYSSNPDRVVSCAEEFIEGHQVHGVVTCLKHFPGHGRALSDSHKGLTDITNTWTEDELYPYATLVEHYYTDAIMLGHLVHRAYDDLPATLSPYWVKVLREQIKFVGTLITDDMHMGAITQNYGLIESAVLALKAGVDLLVFSNNPAAAQGVEFSIHHDLADRLTDGIVAAVHRGELSVEQLEDSAERIDCLPVGFKLSPVHAYRRAN